MWFNTLEHARAKAIDKYVSTYLQLATTDTKYGVSVRTMVFRGFSEDHRILRLATDQRSHKLKGILQDSRAQIAWYLSDARVQFRFFGHLSAISSTASVQSERDELWDSLSLNTRLSFFADAGGYTDEKSHKMAESCSAPDSFVLLKLSISEVEVLDLNTQPHSRLRYTLHGQSWSQRAMDLN